MRKCREGRDVADNATYRGYRFQMLDHNWIAGHEAFRLLPVQDHGVYFNLRLQAGRTRQEYGTSDGVIGLGGAKRAKKAAVAKWIGAMPGMSAAGATGSLDRLRDAGLITITRGGIVAVARWAEEQGAPPSDVAERQRKSREAKARQVFFDVLNDKRGLYVTRDEICEVLKVKVNGGRKFAQDFIRRSVADGFLRDVDGVTFYVEVVGSGENASNGGGSVPLPPPSISISEGVTSHKSEFVTSHHSHIEKDMNISSKHRNASPRFPNGGGRGTEPTSCCSVTREEIFSKSPLDVCAVLTGATGEWDRNGFAKALREMRAEMGEERGTAKFREAMDMLRADLAEPNCNIRSRPRVFIKKLKIVRGIAD